MMRKNVLLVLCLCLAAISVKAQDMKLEFIKNKNQFPDQVRFKANLPGGAVFLTPSGFTFSYYQLKDLSRIHDLMHEQKDVNHEKVHFHSYKVNFLHANPKASFTEDHKLPHYHNYFIGNDARHWAGEVPLFQTVSMMDIYPGINAVVYSKGLNLKYDFVVAPHSNPAAIQLQYEGVRPQIKDDGTLYLKTTVNTIIEEAPYVYQIVNGNKVTVPSKYKLTGTTIGFEFPDGYDKAETLYIDPVLNFSTFSGSTATTFGYSATYDSTGCLYAGGECFGVGWPYTIGAFQTLFGGSVDDGINKYSSNGTTLVYSTYYGGNNSDLPNNMIVNDQNELVICGTTSSSNLPVTTGCFDNTFNGSTDIYVARFSNTGATLKAATYIGGTGSDGSNTGSLSPNYGDANRGEVLTANGKIYIAGSTSSTNFPVSSNAFQSTNGGAQDAVVCMLDSNLTTMLYSTYLGGTANDAAFSLVLNSTNQIVVCGGTASSNFPTTTGAYHTSNQGGTDGFVSIVSPTGTPGLVHSTYLGTASYDHAFKIQRDNLDHIFVLGQTDNNSGYPVSAGVYSIANGNIFIDELNPTLSASLRSTRMGNASGVLVPTAFMHDVCGNTYLSGFGASAATPVSPGAYQTMAGSFWLGALGPDFANLAYATFFGPGGTHVDGGTSRFDPQGIIYHSACTSDPSFPTTSTAVYPVKQNNSWDIASYKFNMDVGIVHAAFDLANNANDTGCANYFLGFDNLSIGASQYHWDFGDGSTSTLQNPSHTFSAGTHTITLVASRQTGCLLADSTSKTIFVKPMNKPQLVVADTFLCDPKPIVLKADVPNLNSLMSFHWEPVTAITSNPNQAQVHVNTSLSTNFTVYVSNAAVGECVDTAMATVHISLFDYSNMKAMPFDTTICPGDTVLMRAYGGTSYVWTPDQEISSSQTAFTTAWPSNKIGYNVRITNDSGCAIDKLVTINMFAPVLVDAGLDQDIKLGESTQLNATANGSIIWTPSGAVIPDNDKYPTVNPDRTTTYYLSVRTPDGCMEGDSVTVHVTNAMLPNAFSPNGDGKNEVFKLMPQDERVKLKEFSVFNRYGQRVFFTKDIKEGWNGAFNGKPCDLDTYFYYVQYLIGEKTYKLKGDVTLLR